MEDTNTTSPTAAETIAQPLFYPEKFAEDSKIVESRMLNSATDSKTLEETLDELSQEVIDIAAKERSKNPLVQRIIRSYWTLTNADPIKITNNFKYRVEEIMQDTEKRLRAINMEITQSSRNEENLLVGMAQAKKDEASYLSTIAGYNLQIREMEEIMASQIQGKNPAETVTLLALPTSYYKLGLSELGRAKANKETKLRLAELGLYTIYSKTSTLGTQMEEAEKTTQMRKAQYNATLTNQVRLLKAQSKTSSPAYISVIQTQIEMTKGEEQAEKRINSHNQVVSALYRKLDERLDLFLTPYRANYEDDTEAMRSKDNIDKAFGEMGKEGQIGVESLRTDAHAVFNKYLP